MPDIQIPVSGKIIYGKTPEGLTVIAELQSPPTSRGYHGVLMDKEGRVVGIVLNSRSLHPQQTQFGRMAKVRVEEKDHALFLDTLEEPQELEAFLESLNGKADFNSLPEGVVARARRHASGVPAPRIEVATVCASQRDLAPHA